DDQRVGHAVRAPGRRSWLSGTTNPPRWRLDRCLIADGWIVGQREAANQLQRLKAVHRALEEEILSGRIPKGPPWPSAGGWRARESLGRALDRKARAGWPTCAGRRLERAAQFDESRPSCEVIGRHQRCVSKHGVPRGRRDFWRIDVEDVSNANGRRP